MISVGRIALLAALAVSTLAGCVSTWDSDVTLNSPPDSDRKYFKSYTSVTRDKKIIMDFETRYTVSATYLSPQFKEAFSRRFQSIFNGQKPFLDEAGTKVGFFVTMFAPEDEGYDITDDQLWSVELKALDKLHKPALIKKLRNKARWRPFFADVHNWSQEYLILFDVPTQSLSDKMVKRNHLALMFANADAKVFLNW